VSRRYHLPRVRISVVREGSAPFDAPPVASTADDAAAIAAVFLADSPHEQLIALCLDARNRVRTVMVVATGGLHSLSVTVADVLRCVLATGQNAFVLSHNHPGGDPTPSREDVHFTKRVREGAEVVGLSLVDHVIVGDPGTHCSMLEAGLL
jgi:DNA repair protein RadC